MSIISNPIVFYPSAVLIIMFALLAIKFHNIFYSLISAMVVFALAALFFYVLGSEYNAIVQVAIYGVAVPIVLGLAIMFTKTQNTLNIKAKSNIWIFIIASIFVLALVYLMVASFSISPNGFNLIDKFVGAYNKSLWVFGQGLFIKYVWAFELLSLILTIIVAGLTILKKEGRVK